MIGLYIVLGVALGVTAAGYLSVRLAAWWDTRHPNDWS